MDKIIAIALVLVFAMAADPAFAWDKGDRIERYYDRRGDEIASYSDEKGDRLEAKYERLAIAAALQGDFKRAVMLDEKGERLDAYYDAKGEAINEELDRVGHRIDRKMDRQAALKHRWDHRH